MTDDLIARLSADLRPVSPRALQRKLLLALLIGLVLTIALTFSVLDLRPDIKLALSASIFWIKFGYTLGLGLVGTWAVERLSRPGSSARWPTILAAVIVIVVASLAMVGYQHAPLDARAAMVWGTSAMVCPFLIAGLSIPVLAAILLAMRQLAPTRLELAGAAAGLMAGGLGAWVYSFHCPESGLPFLAIWYSLGIIVEMGLGALLGRFILRW